MKKILLGVVFGMGLSVASYAQQLGNVGGGNEGQGSVREESDGDLSPPVDGGGGVAPGNGNTRRTRFTINQDKAVTRTESSY